MKRTKSIKIYNLKIELSQLGFWIIVESVFINKILWIQMKNNKAYPIGPNVLKLRFKKI